VTNKTRKNTGHRPALAEAYVKFKMIVLKDVMRKELEYD